MTTQQAKSRSLAVFVGSIMVLFCGFQWNLWRVADPVWFAWNLRPAEGHILGRLIKSRTDGLFSAAGLTGVASPNTDCLDFNDDDFEAQHDLYFDSRPCVAYMPYLSHSGGQGLIFGVLDRSIPAAPRARFAWLHALNSLLSAVVLAMIILWFYLEFGLVVSLAVLTSAALAPWLAVFGRNLYHCMWAWYLPMAAAMYFLRRDFSLASRRVAALGVLAFATVLAKCVVTGFEYLTTAAAMLAVPLVYYTVARRQGIGGFVRGSLAVALGTGLAVWVALAILCAQIAAVKGSARAGLDQITHAFTKRTYAQATQFTPDAMASPVFVNSLKATPVEVLEIYLRGSYFGDAACPPVAKSSVAGRLYGVRYWHLVALFLLASAVVLWRSRRETPPPTRRRDIALVLAVWASLLAPMSWFVIFKAHSYVHTHMNFVTWHMPFTFFGFALVGLALAPSRGLCGARQGQVTSAHGIPAPR